MPFVFEIIARAVLLPVLVAQGLFLQARTLRLPEPDGPRSGTMGQGPALSVLIIGDSSAAGVGVDHQDVALAGHLTQTLAQTHLVTWHLHAKTGVTTSGVLQSLDDLPDIQFDVAVQALGVNDITSGTSLRRWLQDQHSLAQALRDRHGIEHFWITGVPPMSDFPLLPNPLRWVLGRQAMRFDLAQRARCNADATLHYVPVQSVLDATTMASDGFHPGPAIYADWGQGTADLITSTLRTRKPGNQTVV
ncbi:SGNH/GDSL hydrolase family protein [Ascidiaceihabitans sp.]|uniref:SGNH/GDSL hydrolase family protein n=1 Tax=Ascidiaceihabitans sp. TaxID=1872644 RepID=UPI00329A14A0